jgi:hypothetical protein
VSRRDAVCLSCHLDGGLHTTRLEDPERDPHSDVMCVSCHESSNNLVTLTVAVPVRAAHYVGGFIGKRGGQEYGTPVRNAACSGCHESALVGTFENEARGIRISHAEPLESKALCSDCHAPHEGTGVTDGYTVGMETCLRCHDAQTASAKCDYCHTKDVGFAVAARSAVKPTTHVDIVSCGGCHSQKRCDSCHGIRMPHSAAFKNWGHARVAVEDIWYNDGRMCKRCHTDNRRPCARCHGSAFPAHPSKYMPKGHQTADPNSNGCDGCHNYNRWIAGRNFCGICHEKYLGAPIPRR